jgi:hypothetical protein
VGGGGAVSRTVVTAGSPPVYAATVVAVARMGVLRGSSVFANGAEFASSRDGSALLDADLLCVIGTGLADVVVSSSPGKTTALLASATAASDHQRGSKLLACLAADEATEGLISRGALTAATGSGVELSWGPVTTCRSSVSPASGLITAIGAGTEFFVTESAASIASDGIKLSSTTSASPNVDSGVMASCGSTVACCSSFSSASALADALGNGAEFSVTASVLSTAVDNVKIS